MTRLADLIPAHRLRNIGRSLKWLRVTVQIVCVALITWALTAVGMKIPALAVWLVKIQFLPAAMAFSVTIFISWLILTLVFGRIYCSSVCPLGVWQDFFARLPRLRRRVKPRWHYHFETARTRVRVLTLSVVGLSILLGFSIVTSLLDPYSIYARFAVNYLKPLWEWGYNQVATVPMQYAAASAVGCIVAFVISGAIAAVAFKHGRLFCNTLCPVGTTLGFVSRSSIFKIDINTDRCVRCRACEHVCKSKCINITEGTVDTSRCVVCFDCVTTCNNEAISYTFRRHTLSLPLMQRVRPVAGAATGMSASRRRFLSVAALAAAAPAAVKAESIVSKISNSGTAVTPPGVNTRREFLDRCTGCGLCVSRCPQKVLYPSVSAFGKLRALHPVAVYDVSWCEYNCTVCTNICPTGALHPLTPETKHHQRVGLAVTDHSACISFAGGVKCGACSRRCPTEAITMAEPDDPAVHGPYPVVDPAKCIGCGSCQYVCPATPLKAIRVSGSNN